ncbi:hypothetical protein [Methanobrevibacter sp.]|uniref:hypothetical protein n=1 Tax=Methanobrevibacter sp. TaxID=66852 RepID=UPI00388DFBD5
MINFKVLISLLVLLPLCLGAVCAADMNHTDDSISVDSNLSGFSGVGSSQTHHLDILGVADSDSSSLDDKLGSPDIIVNTPKPIHTVDVSLYTPKGTFDDLQLEINKAAKGSVLILNKDYNGHKGSRIDLSKDLTIDGQGHTLNCLGLDGCSAFYSSSGKIVLKNLNIINGHNDNTKKGGAIYIKGSAQYTIYNCTFSNNWAKNYGGAIYNENKKDLVVDGCVFKGNKANGENGGAIFSNGIVHINQCDFINNLACVDGGAVCCENHVGVVGSSFTSNKATGAKVYQCWGGAIKSSGTVTVEDSIFIKNYAADYGGAIYANNVYVMKNNATSIFEGNTADDNDGGAVYAKNDVRAYDTSFANNVAQNKGGAIYGGNKVSSGGCFFMSNSVRGSSHDYSDGGAVHGCEVFIDNSTFEDNRAVVSSDGGAVYSVKHIHININQDISNPSYSYFTGNSAHYGGALYSAAGNIYGKNVVFELNKASDSSIARSTGLKCFINLTNCFYQNNFCNNKGGKDFDAVKVYTDNNALIVSLKGDNVYDDLSSVSLDKENVTFWVDNSKNLKDIFSFIENKKPLWNNINITLAPHTTFKVDFTDYHNFALHIGNANLCIKGTVDSVICGNDNKNNFLYVRDSAKVSLVNVTVKNFKHCFINKGTVCCIKSNFLYNDAYDKYTLVSGGVMENYGSVYFDKCLFKGNRASMELTSVSVKEDYWGSVLYAGQKSFNVFHDCDFKDSLSSFIKACDYSLTVLYQDNNLDNVFKDCYFAKTACLSTVSNQVYEDKFVLNCSDVSQLKNALYLVNSFTPNCESVVINLEPGVYEMDNDWLVKDMRSMDWRDEFYHHSVYTPDYKAPSAIERYALDVGVIPIVINGNGATVRLSKNVKNHDDHFAFIGYGGLLTLNNISFSNFNGIFHNYGTLNLINCNFSDNYYKNYGAVLNGNGCSNYLINCTFKSNIVAKDNTNILDVSDAFVRFDGCDFSEFFKNTKFIGKAKNSVVESSSAIKDNLILSGDSVFYNIGDVIVNGSVIHRGETYTVNIIDNDYLTNLTQDILLFEPSKLIMNVSCDCDIDLSKLNYCGDLLILGNGFNVNFDFGKTVNVNSAITFVNLTFTKYSHAIFNIAKNCMFMSCNFINNKGAYLFKNKGSCSLFNCSFYGNKNSENLIYNDGGSLILCSCSVRDNSYSNYGLIYNNKGSLVALNSTFTNNGKSVIANFETDDCAVFNSTGCNVLNDYEKYSMTEKILIRTALTWTVGIVSFGVGFVVSGVLTPFLVAVTPYIGWLSIIPSSLIGAGIGMGFGFIDDAVIGGSARDHSNRWNIITQYMIIGAALGAIGGTYGYLHPFFKLKKESEQAMAVYVEEQEKPEVISENENSEVISENKNPDDIRQIFDAYDISKKMDVEINERTVKLYVVDEVELSTYNKDMVVNSVVMAEKLREVDPVKYIVVTNVGDFGVHVNLIFSNGEKVLFTATTYGFEHGYADKRQEFGLIEED